MPTYQYVCTACGHQLEAVQSFADEPLTECPSCEGRLRKLFNSVGIVFKGSGFYRTDSRSTNSDSTPGTKPAESSGAKSESGAKSDASGAGSAGKDSSAAKPSAPAASGSGGSTSKPAAAAS
ncbi:FmdB family zinc ribbon protein [Plantactinospora sp. KBS50]|uniref:FmdB family zinc ribbon protein n=1 Tax=Plantactinospora sp. KBS50 TaxID=2024580 RepID=UPI000BAB1CE7|nr:FmdB family zinc ribbon protein [Plantactinospora sp. KBS50]ASW53406.1 FmdB family transcriptional regulator [Plantactinospora sp. KBS50]